MGRIDELVSAEFAVWEQRGRGWQVWSEPVRPEPPFREFTGYRLAQSELREDDGRRRGFLASLFDSFEKRVDPHPPDRLAEPTEPAPAASERPLTAEFVASLPASLNVTDEILSCFLDSLHVCAEPTGFELLGNRDVINLQFASSARDAPALRRQLDAFFPKLAFTPTQETLDRAWNGSDGVGCIIDFGLAHEFMLPLQSGHAVDPFVGLVAALNELQDDEVAVLQVLFEPVHNSWPQSVWRSVTDKEGKALFVNQPNLIPGTKEKLETPLFGVVVRAAAKATTFERAAEVVRDMASALRTFTRLERNRLIPLHNEGYPFRAHEDDVLRRQTHRSGMILNVEELMGFVHFPSSDVQSPKLCRLSGRTKSAPASVTGGRGIILGENRHLGHTVTVSLTNEERVKHCHIIGGSGTGKSTLLFNLIRQDIEHGEGVGVLDPHGDLIDRILGVIPAGRIKDVILIDPTDEEFSVGFNILSAHSDLEKNLLASDLVSVFRRLSTSWGDQMESVLRNAILAFLESSRGGTLSDLRRFLIEPAFRDEFLNTVRDPDIVYYWRRGFTQLSGNKSIGPVLTRLDGFLAPKPLRYMVAQAANRLDFTDILDSGKIFLAKLPQGQIGKENSFLLGSLFVAKFQQVTMGRQAQRAESRRPYFLYIDEFHNFITPSMAEILTSARKYQLGLIVAHQQLQQLERERDVASAVMANAYTRMIFGVGDDDARKLAGGLSFFEARDLQNLEKGQAICRIEKSSQDFNLAIPLPNDPEPHEAQATREVVIAASREKYATPRAEIEAAFLKQSTVAEERKPLAVPKPKPAKPEILVSELKPVEVSKTSGSEMATPPVANEAEPVSVSEAAAPAKPVTPADMGIGGAAHKAIQKRLKEVAEEVGFRATIEKKIPEGSVDLLLEKPGFSIACEITVTNTVANEVENVSKCLKVGFTNIVVISEVQARLDNIRAGVASSLGPDALAAVTFFQPEGFISHLRGLAPQPPPVPASVQPQTRRGYKVTRKVSEMTEEERLAREAVMVKQLAEAMKRRPPSSA